MGAIKRDAKGRFVNGGAPGPGRKPVATEEEYAKVFKEVVPLERFAKMLEKQAVRAEHGNLPAFMAIVSRLVPERKDLSMHHDGSLAIPALEEMINLVYGDGAAAELTQAEQPGAPALPS